MPDIQSSSALDNPTGRLAARFASFSDKRPQPPRDFRAEPDTNTLRWTPPADSIITHYRLRVDHDDGDSDFELNEGTHIFQPTFGDRFCLTAYNRAARLESAPVYVTYHATGGGGEDCGCTGGFTRVENKTMTADDTIPNTSIDPCTGDQLTWFITFDSASAPWLVTGWGSQYQNPPTTALDGTADTLSQVRFVGRSNKWYCEGYETGLVDL